MTMLEKDKNNYIKQYPEVKRWLNQCVVCQAIGYKPEMPKEIHPGLLAQNIRKYFSPLSINELGICEDCVRAAESHFF